MTSCACACARAPFAAVLTPRAVPLRSEVAKKDFEKEGIQPPEGMEVKKYEH